MRIALPLAALVLVIGLPASHAAQANGDRNTASHDQSKAGTERPVDHWIYDQCARILANPEDHWPIDVKRCRAVQH
jgi:hypothetical protein